MADVVWHYEKTHLVPGLEANVVPGDGQVPTVQTPYGRLSGVVCFDMDFPGTIRQAGQAGADMMLVPASPAKTSPSDTLRLPLVLSPIPPR